MKILVTGGGGFLGLAICKMLKARGDEVVSYSRKAYPELESLGVIQVQGDL
ncbi:MAG: NAD-dependent epimerase/dehydratase family protein, partial [Planctomycetia bacterium]